MSTQPKDALTLVLQDLAAAAALVGLFALGAVMDPSHELDVAQALAVEAARAQAEEAERERVRRELLPKVRAAYQQGLDDGAERERARVAELKEWQR